MPINLGIYEKDVLVYVGSQVWCTFMRQRTPRFSVVVISDKGRGSLVHC